MGRCLTDRLHMCQGASSSSGYSTAPPKRKRPPERVLHDRVIVNANTVEFSVNPKVMKEANEFL